MVESEMKRCPFCAEEIQAAAIRCRHCHADLAAANVAKQPVVRPAFAVLGVLLLVLFGAALFAAAVDPKKPSTKAVAEAAQATKQDDDDQTMAWVMAKEFVKRGLKSPGSADFGSVFRDYQSPDSHVRKLGPGRYEAHGWVDSQNGFGALARTSFTITLERKGADNWDVVEGPTFGSQ